MELKIIKYSIKAPSLARGKTLLVMVFFYLKSITKPDLEILLFYNLVKRSIYD